MFTLIKFAVVALLLHACMVYGFLGVKWRTVDLVGILIALSWVWVFLFYGTVTEWEVVSIHLLHPV